LSAVLDVKAEKGMKIKITARHDRAGMVKADVVLK
jgi:hypothetical protein